jgi:hypothetical protein
VEVQVLCFAPHNTKARSTLVGRAFVCLALGAAVGAASPGEVVAHEGDDPTAHREMPFQVTAGLVAVCPSTFTRATDVTTTIGCLGGEISGAFAPAILSSDRPLELRLRLAYARPVTGDGPTIDELRATIGADWVASLAGGWTMLTVGPNLGLVGVAVDDRWLPGLFVGGTVGVRPFVTFHTGFFAELSFGASLFFAEEHAQSASLGRLVLGWADRF